jgi:hypothetical protein
VEGDPTDDIRVTRRISAVWVRGARIDRGGYRAELARKQAETAARESAAKAAIAAGVISNFDDMSTKTPFGAGWSETTDRIAGGKSTVALKVVSGGAHDSRGALRISGQITSDSRHPWAGAMFSPGSSPMSPADLSSKRVVAFSVKGDGKTYRVMLFSQRRGFRPSVKTFTATAEWRDVRFPIADFEGLDGRDIIGIAVVAGPREGAFEFEVDQVRLE